MKRQIINQTYDEERALYNLKDAEVIQCTFAGPQDGESALKECSDVTICDSLFSLRYPLWHAKKFQATRVSMDEKTRASIWYAQDGELEECKIDGVKCLRECQNIKMTNCKVHSPEFGWRCLNVHISNSEMESEYFLFESKNIQIDHLQMKGKYSFQYVEDMTICDSVLNTKDAFWHGKNITVKDSVIIGEYLAWFSENLTLINCKIVGTQPFCYCKGLKLINCTMENTDLAFEYSEVDAEVIGTIESVKNPKSGTIIADGYNDIIWDNPAMEVNGKVIIRR